MLNSSCSFKIISKSKESNGIEAFNIFIFGMIGQDLAVIGSSSYLNKEQKW